MTGPNPSWSVHAAHNAASQTPRVAKWGLHARPRWDRVCLVPARPPSLRVPPAQVIETDAHLVLDRTEETGLLLRRLTTLVENCENLALLVSICA